MDADIQTPGPIAQRTHGVPARLLGDERLALEVGAGSERAFTVMYRRYHQPLYRYCRGLTGTDQDAQDALQTTFTKALVALREGRRNAPLRPWLYRIAHNESISAIRARVAVAGKVPLEMAASIGVSDRAEERERITTLVADLRELPEQQRGALVMRELSGLSHEEIANALQISVGAAKQSILEARRSLLEFEEGRAMTCDAVQRIISDDDRRSLRSRRVRAHMRECVTCAAFAQAIPTRRADMLALWPVLPAATSAGLLAKITAGSAGSGHGGSGVGLAAGTAAKGIGATISVKAAVATGAAVLTTATVGAVAVLHPQAGAPSPSHGAATAGHRLSSHQASAPGHGSAATRAAASAHASTSSHRAIGKGLGPAAGKHAAGQSSHGRGTSSPASAGSPGAPGQTRNYGHSSARSATSTHHGPRHAARGKPVKVNPSVANKSTNPNVGHGRLKPKTHKPAHVIKSQATVVTHTRTTAAVTHTRSTAVTRTRTTDINTTTPAKTRTTAATVTTSPAVTTTRTTGKPTTTSTASSTSAATTLTASTNVTSTSSTPAATPSSASTPAATSVDSGIGNGGTPPAQSAGSSGGQKISK